MTNVAAVTRLLSTPNETFSSNLAASASPGDAIIYINNLALYADDDVVVLTISPGLGAQVTFTGVKKSSPSRVENVVFTEGNLTAGWAAGATVIDYDSATHFAMLSKALKVHTNQDGTLKTSAVQAALNISGAAPADYIALANAPASVVALGCRSYQLTYAGVDYTDRLNPKTRLRTVRSVAAPITSSLHNGVNQYWSNASPTKLSFTNNFAIVVDVKISSYGTSGITAIVSRYNGTSGFRLVVEASSGKIFLIGHNAGSGNYTQVGTIGSLPLNKWVRITAQLDMTVTTNTPTTSYIMFDEVDMPSTVNRAGTNPTALIQAGSLEVGSENGGTNILNGYVAQVGIFNAKITQATMLTYASQSLLGTEPNLAVGYSFGGNANDLNTTTPHNLTSNGGITALNAAAPWGTQGNDTISSTVDHGIIMQVTKPASDTIVIVQVPEGCKIPTIGGVASSSYSSAATPFGFPGQKDRWCIEYKYKTQLTVILASNTVWGNIVGVQFLLPIGNWDVQNKFNGIITAATPIGYIASKYTISNANNTQKWDYISGSTGTMQASTGQLNSEVKIEGVLNLLANTILYLNAQAPVISGQTNAYMSADEPGMFRFYNGLL